MAKPSAGGTLMRYMLLPFTPRYIVFTIAVAGTSTLAALALRYPQALIDLAFPLVFFGFFTLIGIRDVAQTKHDFAQLSHRCGYRLHSRAYPSRASSVLF